MTDWISLIGIGEEGAAGLSDPARAALARADVVFGGPRHLAMVAHGDKRSWPVPFSLAPMLALRGRARVAMLVSGDPFWHGAGGSLAQLAAPSEWRCYPAASVASLAAARLGWRLEDTLCLGLHAQPLAVLRRHLHPGQRLIVTLRDGAAGLQLAQWLSTLGYGASELWLLERLGGPEERIRRQRADSLGPDTTAAAPLTVALEVAGPPGLPRAAGLPDATFAHDGQITKRPVRALALSALAPRPGELLWDLGTGSGSVALEWLLSHPSTRAIGLERDPARAARARANAADLGLSHFTVLEGESLALIADLPDPAAVFIGGGLDAALLGALWDRLPAGCRLVAHGVTLETEALLGQAAARHGGSLLRIALSEAQPLGRKRGWKSAYPVLQWVVVR